MLRQRAPNVTHTVVQAPLGAQTTKRHTDQKWLGCQNGTKQHVQNTLVIFATYCKTKKQQLVTSPKHMPNSKPLISIMFCKCFRTRGIDTNDGCSNQLFFVLIWGSPGVHVRQPTVSIPFGGRATATKSTSIIDKSELTSSFSKRGGTNQYKCVSLGAGDQK